MDIPNGLKLLLEVHGSKERIGCSMVGHDDGAYIVCKPLSGALAKLASGLPVMVRCLLEGEVVGFPAKIMGFVAKPAPLVFLSWPQEMERQPLRKAKRVDCNFPGVFLHRGREHKGLIIDLSSGGCRIRFDQLGPEYQKIFQAGDELKVFFYIFDKDDHYSVDAVIQNVSVEKGKLAAGLRFEKIRPDVKQKIDDYVDSVLLALQE